MTNLSLRLTTNGPNLKGKLAIQCTTKYPGQPVKRHFKLISGLVSPSFEAGVWDEKQGFFISGANASTNNAIIAQTLEKLQGLINSGEYLDGKQLFAAYDHVSTKIAEASALTLGKFIETIINRLEDEAQSSNVEQYKTLYHCLLGVNRKVVSRPKMFPAPTFQGVKLFDTVLKAVSNKHFIAFGEWIKTCKDGLGYRNLMTTFKAVMSKAHQQELTENVISYKFKAHLPTKKVVHTTAKQKIQANGQNITVLSVEEFEAFKNFDVLTIARPQAHYRRLLQIYKDTVLLMYYTRSRPVDVISFRWGHEYDEESGTIVYTPRKLTHRLSTSGSPRYVTIKLPAEAIEIVNKYRGQSRAGYILPLPMNEKRWDYDTEFKTWYVRIKNVEGRINAYLKKIAQALNLEVQDLSMYDFRHSAITHAINAGEDAFLVARQAGTSVINIEKHYYNTVR